MSEPIEPAHCTRCGVKSMNPTPTKFKSKRYQCDITIRGYLCETCVINIFGAKP